MEELEIAGFNPIYVFLDLKDQSLSTDIDVRRNTETLSLAADLLNTNKIYKLKTTPKALGLGTAMLTGIDWFFSEVKYGLILEDDCKIHSDAYDFLESIYGPNGDLDARKNVTCLTNLSDMPNTKLSDAPFMLGNFFISWGWFTNANFWQTFRNWDMPSNIGYVRCFLRCREIGIWSRLILAAVLYPTFKKVKTKKMNLWAIIFTLFTLDSKQAIVYPRKNLILHEINPGRTNLVDVPAWYRNINFDFTQNKFQFKKSLEPQLVSSALNRTILKNLYGVSTERLIKMVILQILNPLGPLHPRRNQRNYR